MARLYRPSSPPHGKRNRESFGTIEGGARSLLRSVTGGEAMVRPGLL